MSALKFLVIFLLSAAPAWAADMVIVPEKAMIYAEPNVDSATKGFIKKGKTIKTFSDDGEFVEVKLKSGEKGWIKSSDVRAKEQETEVEGSEPSQAKGDDDFRRWQLQLGFSSGSSSGKSYTEINLGVGYYFFRWLEWQNSLFASLDRVENIYGLDSSLRGVLNLALGGVGHVHMFAGPGYRLASKTDLSIPFAEAGLIANVAGFSLGGGVRQFFYSTKDANRPNENQYFIILSGSTSF